MIIHVHEIQRYYLDFAKNIDVAFFKQEKIPHYSPEVTPKGTTRINLLT